MRAGLIDEYVLATAPVLVGGGTPFFTALDSWVNLNRWRRGRFPRCDPDQVRDEALSAATLVSIATSSTAWRSAAATVGDQVCAMSTKRE